MVGFRRRVAVAALFGAALGGGFIGCGYNWDFVDEDGGGDGSLGADVNPNAAGDAALDAPSVGEVGAGGGCSSSADCDAIDFCVFPDHLCGRGMKGVCQPQPDCTAGGTLPANGDLICGCDGI